MQGRKFGRETEADTQLVDELDWKGKLALMIEAAEMKRLPC